MQVCDQGGLWNLTPELGQGVLEVWSLGPSHSSPHC